MKIEAKSNSVVLIIEDDSLQAEAYATFLVDSGGVPLIANSYEQGMKLLRQHAGIIDHVVCDNQLGSTKAGARIREFARSFDIGCTVISARKESGVDFVKPIGPELLRALVYGAVT